MTTTLKIFLYLITTLVVNACSGFGKQAEPEFFHLQALDAVDTYENRKGKLVTLRLENFVVAHAPDNPDQLKQAVKKFNLETLTQADIEKHEGYIRSFFKESRTLPRDFREQDLGIGYEDTLEEHNDDMVLQIIWKKYGKEIEYVFMKKGMPYRSDNE